MGADQSGLTGLSAQLEFKARERERERINSTVSETVRVFAEIHSEKLCLINI